LSQDGSELGKRRIHSCKACHNVIPAKAGIQKHILGCAAPHFLDFAAFLAGENELDSRFRGNDSRVSFARKDKSAFS
jgi:hypothetical protein